MNAYVQIVMIMLKNEYTVEMIKKELAEQYNLNRRDILNYIEIALDEVED